jgi:hypothetical protein
MPTNLDKKLQTLYSNLLDDWISNPTNTDSQLLRDINAYIINMKNNKHKSKLLSMQKKLISRTPQHILETDTFSFPE